MRIQNSGVYVLPQPPEDTWTNRFTMAAASRAISAHDLLPVVDQ